METFFNVYREELRKSVAKTPNEYAIGGIRGEFPNETPEAYAERVAEKMIQHMREAKGVDTVNTDSLTFRRTCKRLGIGYNRKAMTMRIQQDLYDEIVTNAQ